MKLLKLLFLASAVLTIVDGCSTNAATKVSNNLTAPYLTDGDNQDQDDHDLTLRLQEKLEHSFPDAKLKVVVKDYNVLIVGQVVSAAEKTQVTTLVTSSPSSRKIFNYVTLATLPKLNLEAAINTKATDRVSRQNDLAGDKALITTCDGVVYIMGSNLGNLSSLNLAIRGIYSIDGVSKVVNLVQPGDKDYYVPNN